MYTRRDDYSVTVSELKYAVMGWKNSTEIIKIKERFVKIAEGGNYVLETKEQDETCACIST